MKRPNNDKIQDINLLALGIQNLCTALQDRGNQGSVIALEYLADGMDKKLKELARVWAVLKKDIYA